MTKWRGGVVAGLYSLVGLLLDIAVCLANLVESRWVGASSLLVSCDLGDCWSWVLLGDVRGGAL